MIELNYKTEVSPTGQGDDILDAETSESIALTTITQETSYIQNTGPVNSTLSYALHFDEEYDDYNSATRRCSFKLGFTQYAVHQSKGVPETGLSLRWHVEDNTGKKITMEDLDLEIVNVTWCRDDSDYGATSAQSDYDYVWSYQRP